MVLRTCFLKEEKEQEIVVKKEKEAEEDKAVGRLNLFFSFPWFGEVGETSRGERCPIEWHSAAWHLRGGDGCILDVA